jgi:hypothetical protein
MRPICPQVGAQLLAVIAALIDGVDLIALTGAAALQAADRARLAAQARQRCAVLLPVGS